MSLFAKDNLDEALRLLKQLGLDVNSMSIDDYLVVVNLSRIVSKRYDEVSQSDVADWVAVEMFTRGKEKVNPD